MWGFNPEKQRGDGPIYARTINRAIVQAEKNARLSVGGDLSIVHVNGIPMVSRDPDGDLIVAITEIGTGGKYAWKAILPDPANPGEWVDDENGLTGSLSDDPLYESNGNDSLPVGFIVDAFRSEVGDLRTQMDLCQ